MNRVLLLDDPMHMVLPVLAHMEIEARKSPEQKERDRQEWRDRQAQWEAEARAYRTEKPEGKAAQRRLRQMERAAPTTRAQRD